MSKTWVEILAGPNKGEQGVIVYDDVRTLPPHKYVVNTIGGAYVVVKTECLEFTGAEGISMSDNEEDDDGEDGWEVNPDGTSNSVREEDERRERNLLVNGTLRELDGLVRVRADYSNVFMYGYGLADKQTVYHDGSSLYHILFDNGGLDWVPDHLVHPYLCEVPPAQGGSIFLQGEQQTMSKFNVVLGSDVIGMVETGTDLARSGEFHNHSDYKQVSFKKYQPMLDKWNGSSYQLDIQAFVKGLRAKGWSTDSVTIAVRLILPTTYQNASTGWSDSEVRALVNEIASAC